MSEAPVVRLVHGGELRGVWRERSAAFLGIPFAEPPVGPLRFAGPVPTAPWSGVRDAVSYGPTAQLRSFDDARVPEPSIPGDGILTVNVFTPAPGDADAGLPVLVWIHGGGFKGGSPASPWYDGFAFNAHGVVTVTLGYRLGFDGFGALPDAPDNRGLLDQIEALRWVREHIASFGGNPGNVTIAGQSAGGASVWALLVSPPARGLFQAAISQAGALDLMSAEQAQANGRRLAELAGVDWRRDALQDVPQERMVALAEAMEAVPPPENLRQLLDKVLSGRIIDLPFLPYVDPQVLPLRIEDALAAGVGAEVPVMAGANAHEFGSAGSEFRDLLPAGALREALADTALADLAEEYLAAYGGRPDGDALVLGQLIGDRLFRIPLPHWADLRGDAPTWLYDFRLTHPATRTCDHCAEIPFVFDNLGADKVSTSSHPEAPQALADAVHGAWVEFLHTHHAPWPTFLPGEVAMVFDTRSEVRPAFVLERKLASALALGR